MMAASLVGETLNLEGLELSTRGHEHATDGNHWYSELCIIVTRVRIHGIITTHYDRLRTRVSMRARQLLLTVYVAPSLSIK